MDIVNPHTRFVNRSLNSQFNVGYWWLLALIGLVVARLVQALWLDPSYVASQYPVPFYVGQMTFDAAELKSYYQVMLDKGTMPVYWSTQCIDFVFIACTYLAFFALSQSIFHSMVRVFPNALRWRNVAAWMCFIAPLAAVADAIENLLSFILLLQPVSFPDFLVYPYSSFAAIKFFLFALTYLWALVMAVVLVLTLCGRTCYGLVTGKAN